MTRTGSLAPQASISTLSGWTVTATYRGIDPHSGGTLHSWWVAFTHGDMCGLTLPAFTTVDGEPNPLTALESVTGWLACDGDFYLGDGAARDITAAIAGMYGDDRPGRCACACGCDYKLTDYAPGEDVCGACLDNCMTAEPCPDCHAEPGEACHYDCSSNWK